MTMTSVTQQSDLKWILLYSSWIKYGDSNFQNQKSKVKITGSQGDLDFIVVVTPLIFRVSNCYKKWRAIHMIPFSNTFQARCSFTFGFKAHYIKTCHYVEILRKTRYQTCLRYRNVPSKLYEMHQDNDNCKVTVWMIINFDVHLRRSDAIDFVHLTQSYGIFLSIEG